jgi:hypothetical protein
MVRISKQHERRMVYKKKHKKPAAKTGPLKSTLPEGYKPHDNAVEGDLAKSLFIPKIK